MTHRIAERLALAVLLSVVLTSAGCVVALGNRPSARPAATKADGDRAGTFTRSVVSGNTVSYSSDYAPLPHDRYLVAGGDNITYTARSAGTLIYADARSRRIIRSVNVDAGEEQTFVLPDERRTDDARPVLYFIRG